MKRKDILTLVLVGVVAAVISLVVANIVFKTPAGRSASVPVAPAITSSFPDVKNSPAYQNIFNSQALDPAQPIQISGNQNSSPFNGSQ